jgi:flagellar biogenesis protein FliO
MKTKRFTVQILSCGAIALGICSQAFATSTLKQVQVSNGSQIDLLFDSKVSKNQIKTEFFNDVIQISLTDVSVYPAKISSVSGGNITKIFAYQYAPKLVRCRLSVKGRAESYKDKIQLVSSAGGGGKMITVRLDGGTTAATTDQVVTQASRAQTKQQVDSGAKNEAKADAPAKIDDADEKALLDRVMKNAPVQAAVAAERPQEKAQERAQEKYGDKALDFEKSSPFSNRSENRPLAGGKPLPSPMNALGKLAFVVGLFALLAWGFKKFWKDRADSSIASASPLKQGLMTSISQFARKNLGKNSKKMIEVVSTHHLGPKKSIAVVRVAGRMLVLGITDDSINLITQMSGQTNDQVDGIADAEMGMDDFGDTDGMGKGFDFAGLLGVKAQPKTQASKAPAQVNPAQAAQVGRNAATGAVSAGPAVFSDILQAETIRPAMGTPIANNKLARPAADVRVTGYGSSLGSGFAPSGGSRPSATAPIVSAQAAQGLSGVRAQIRSKLEGLKQI